MEPIKFDGANAVFGANQPEYIPLPAEKRPGRSGEIVTCWELNPNEKKIIQETVKIWLSVLTVCIDIWATLATFVVND